jgi:RNA polymerase sigma-70 factor, ECF subfamily
MTMQRMRPVSRTVTAGDRAHADAVERLVEGDHSALGELYLAYAGLVFAVARRSVDVSRAEEITQDTFLQVWRFASRYDPARASVKTWIMAIGHNRTLNELRHMNRRPRLVSDDEAVRALGDLPDRDAGPLDAVLADERRSIVRTALDDLATSSRDAVSLAFVDQLTHREVAAAQGVSLGTAKSRVRDGLIKMRRQLTTAALALIVIGATIGWRGERQARATRDAALAMLTNSSIYDLRLVPADGVDPKAHGHYRAVVGTNVAVLTTTALPRLSAGSRYVVWVDQGHGLVRVGVIAPDSTGAGRMLWSDERAAARTNAVVIDVESTGGSRPSGPVDVVLASG